MGETYVNFGAGNPVAGWANLDSSPMFRLPALAHRLLAWLRVSRARHFKGTDYQYFRYLPGRQLPFPEASVSVIYCSHVLEHLPADHIPALLDSFHRVLIPGGIVRIVVPDLEGTMRRVVDEEAPIVDLMSSLGTMPEILLRKRVRAVLESLVGFPSVHKTMVRTRFLETIAGNRWIARDLLGYLNSNIDLDTLALVEIPERCEGALVAELVRK